MIYDNTNIQIPVLCPIQFREPKEIVMYERQTVYTPKINGDTFIQVLVSQSVHDTKSKLLYLKLYDINDVLQETYYFTRILLSTGYHYASTTINPTFEGFGYFKIEYDGEDLADSVCYEINPTYDGDIKEIYYANSDNDWNTVFYNSFLTFELPVKPDINPFFTEAQAIIDATKIRIAVKTSVDAADFDIIISNGTQTFTKNVTSDGSTTYNVDITLAELNAVFTTGIDRNVFFKIAGEDGTISDEGFFVYIGTANFEKTFYFSLFVECGFVPRDFRGEQETEDFLDQTLTNETVYGNHYEIHPLTIGDNGGIPNWLAYKVMSATLCDTFQIDGVDYERVNGSKFEKVEDTENGLAIYKVDLQTENTYLQ